MRQALLHGIRDVRLDVVDVPELPDDGVLVRVEAAGICGSDVHMYHGVDPWGALASYPASFGHEMAGVIERRGGAVREVGVGDRVAVKPMFLYACLSCDACRAGFTTSCARLGLWHGSHRGAAGFAEFEVVAARNVYRVGSSIPADVAALADVYACGIHAVHHLPAGCETVAVIGTGPIALSLAQVCRWAGLDVTVIGRTRSRLVAIADAGIADKVMDVETASGTAAHAFGAGVDAAFECVGGATSEAVRVATAVIKPRGWLGIMGAFGGDVEFGYRDAYRKELTATFLNGYCCAAGDDFARAVQLLDGEVDGKALISHHFPLQEFSDAIQTAIDRPGSTMKVMVHP